MDITDRKVKSEHDLLMSYNQLDLDMIYNLHRQIQELLKHKQIIEDRKKKIDKLRQNING
jgi:hypothetical protein